MDRGLICLMHMLVLLQHHFVYNEQASSSTSKVYFRYSATWSEAKADCELIGGSLLVFDSAIDMDYVNELYLSSIMSVVWRFAPFWLGLTDVQEEGQYKWLNMELLSHNFSSKWAPNQPDDAGDDDCVSMSETGMKDDPCTANQYFICQVEKGSEAAMAAASVRSSFMANDLIWPMSRLDLEEPLKSPLNNKTFFTPSHVRNYKTWSEADAFCKLENATLASFTSIHDLDIAHRFRLVKQFISGNYWTGGTNENTGGTFKWLNGEEVDWSLFDTEAPGPDAATSCLSYSGQKHISIEPCSTRRAFLCEKYDTLMEAADVSCYWTIETPAQATIEDYTSQCALQGGTPAKVSSFSQYWNINLLFPNLRTREGFVRIGADDAQKTWDWKWYDDRIMTWAYFQPGKPNHSAGFQPEIIYHFWYYRAYDDLRGATTAVCESRGFGSDGMVIDYSDNELTFKCWRIRQRQFSIRHTCSQMQNSSQKCICHDDTWYIIEQWASDLIMSFLYDDDTQTCITSAIGTNFMTLTNNKTVIGDFEIEIVLSPDGADEENPRAKVHVFTSEDIMNHQKTCHLSDVPQFCRQVSSSRFACGCRHACRVYVKVFQSQQAVLPLRVCEVYFAACIAL